MDELKRFFNLIKEMSFFDRVFKWFKIRSLSFNAFSEFQFLEKKIIDQEKKINDLEKTLGENYRVIETINELNEKNTVELKILRAQNTQLSNENSGFKSLNEKRVEEHEKAIGQLNQATKSVENREQKILQEKESREKEKVVFSKQYG